MSGNPFRASLSHKSGAAAPVPPTSFINVDSSSSRAEDDARERASDSVHAAAPSPLPPKTKKSVRIESPTTSALPHSAFDDADDALLQRLNRGQRAGSPPPISPAGFSDDFEDIAADDPFAKERGRADEADALGMMRSSKRNLGAPGTVQSPSGAPANPFSRTLANIEPQEKGSGELAHVGQNRDRTTTEGSSPATTKGSLDVEGFKNLLMKGISSPRSSAPSSQPPAAPHHIPAPVFESSSSTDTSSVSRQSIFEPLQEAHVETPRTSVDMAASDDEERVSLIGEAKKEKKKPPPAPKHRHGKLVTARQPQTVSFSGFSATEPITSAPTTRTRAGSDLNKPLPPTPSVMSPSAHIASQDSTQEQEAPLETKATETSSISDAASIQSTQKRVPPPVPIARRQSQLRTSTAGNRSRSNSSLTMSSQHSVEYSLQSPGLANEPTSSPAMQKSPPPPPPTRRHGAALSGINTSSANSSTTDVTSTGTTRRPTVSSPNPPSSRRTTLSSEPPSPSPGLARTSSIASARNAPRSVSNESAPGAMPPPPPPPRRRQSGRSSLEKERPHALPSSPTESRRTSSENKRSSFDSKRRTSVASESSLKYEYAPASEAEHALYSPKEDEERRLGTELEEVKTSSSNILDDMEKFQREIDELRQKYKHTA